MLTQGPDISVSASSFSMRRTLRLTQFNAQHNIAYAGPGATFARWGCPHRRHQAFFSGSGRNKIAVLDFENAFCIRAGSCIDSRSRRS